MRTSLRLTAAAVTAMAGIVIAPVAASAHSPTATRTAVHASMAGKMQGHPSMAAAMRAHPEMAHMMTARGHHGG